MIIDKLIKHEEFTDIEKSIADYLLRNGYEVKNMSISSLAQVTYSSTSTITRFCHKLDWMDIRNFKIPYLIQSMRLMQKMDVVNVNYPFTGGRFI